jgi:alginate O-acetyltransferase complex protein AlgI
MLFNSGYYPVFLLLVILLYFSLPFKGRNAFLLFASYSFYISWKWELGLLLLFISLLNYFAGLKINENRDPKTGKIWFFSAFFVSISILLYFKFAGFFVEEFNTFFSAIGINVRKEYLRIILPVGLSFYTFQALSYTFDIYRNSFSAEKNMINFLLYVSFFPTLISGPISRASTLLEQLRKEQHFSSDRLIEGSKLIIWGLFKKAVIADRLALYVNQIYSSPASYSGSTLLLATFLFTWQIYCDFSGYSDIAIGSSRILGINVTQNFNFPYLSASIGEFWKRWHISLTTWFRDYVFLPLSVLFAGRIKSLRIFGIKKDIIIYIYASIITWFLTGLWHGTGITFMIWGLLQAFFLIIYKVWTRRKILKHTVSEKTFSGRLLIIYGSFVTFLLVMFSWLFFRAVDFAAAHVILYQIFTDRLTIPYLGSSAFETSLGLFFIFVLFAFEWIQYSNILYRLKERFIIRHILSWSFYSFLIIMIFLTGVSLKQFIYFRF